MARKTKGTAADPFETYVDDRGTDTYLPVNPQAWSQARGLVTIEDENASVDQFREGPVISDEKAAENSRARKYAMNEKVEYPAVLVTPHGR